MSSGETKSGGASVRTLGPILGPSRLAALVLDVNLDPGQSQLGDLTDQRFDALVFVNPLTNLRDEILGDIDGSGFALFLAGEEKAGMARTSQAVAAGVATLFVNGDQAGGHQGAVGLELFDARMELPLDESGVFGDFHIHRG